MPFEGISIVMGNLRKYQDDQIKKMESGMQKGMTEAANHAKMTAPWTDRTGNARNSIFGIVEPLKGDVIKGHHGIGVDYGKYLELSNQGKYRIVWPTIDYMRSRLLNFIANG